MPCFPAADGRLLGSICSSSPRRCKNRPVARRLSRDASRRVHPQLLEGRPQAALLLVLVVVVLLLLLLLLLVLVPPRRVQPQLLEGRPQAPLVVVLVLVVVVVVVPVLVVPPLALRCRLHGRTVSAVPGAPGCNAPSGAGR